MCAFENNIEDIEERKNAFTKKMEKVGKLQGRKRVMIFEDNDVAIDTKTHFEYISPKIELGARSFIDAVEEAIVKKLEEVGEAPVKKKATAKKTTKKPPVVEEEEIDEDIKAELEAHAGDEMYGINEDEIADDTVPFDIDESEEEVVDEDAIITLDDDRLNVIRDAFKASDAATKAKVRKHLVDYNNKLSAEMKTSDVLAIEEILRLNDEV